MNLKSVLKTPESSVGVALATAGLVYSVYSLDVGNVAQAHASDPNHPALEASRKKAGYTSFILVTALSLITRDGNVAIIGYGSVVALELHYRHAIMASPVTGAIVAPSPSAYQPAENVIPLDMQATA